VTASTPADAYDPFASVRTAGSTRPAPRIRIAKPWTGPEELAAIAEVLESGILTNGPWTRAFEEKMAARHGTDHAVAFANGTVALAAMLLEAGIGPGDEVIVPSLTFISTATSVLHVGATPVFADVHEDTLNLDPDDAARRITSRTKAIMPVHYGGQSADLDRLTDLATTHGLLLLEDAAEAHGATFQGRPVGSWGDTAMFSFTPTKNITTGEGGMVLTDDPDRAERMRLLRNHGMSAPYRHDVLGYNWRLSEMQAAMGCCQLDRLDEILVRKRENAAHLGGLLAEVPGIEPPATRDDRDHTYMLFTCRVAGGRRDEVIDGLAERGIESRLYFPLAHRQPVFEGSSVHLPISEALAASVVSLPLHQGLGRDELTEVAAAVAEVLG
jgi:perosamine synthetase